MKKLNKQQEEHLKKLKESFAKALDKKYRAGAAEHGGCIWDNPRLLDEAIDETVDLYAYLMTFRDVLREIQNYD